MLEALAGEVSGLATAELRIALRVGAHIIAVRASENVVAGTTEQVIVGESAVKVVVARASGNGVSPAVATDEVVSEPTVHVVSAIATEHTGPSRRHRTGRRCRHHQRCGRQRRRR